MQKREKMNYKPGYEKEAWLDITCSLTQPAGNCCLAIDAQLELYCLYTTCSSI